MTIEIERKFLVVGNAWQHSKLHGLQCIQGYLVETGNNLVRVRTVGDKGFLAVKARKTGLSRFEYEYEIPFIDAREMLTKLCPKPLIDKTRYEITYEGHRWEIDVFSGLNTGLVVAEIELSAEDESFFKPPWAGREVTDDPRYLNVNLAVHPYRSWPRSD
ncbi:MAG: CYTH domain-containing protein [Syntrophaceae bacterium]|nr:CYTH domain-containing protein [Syntrophaceae bacterium]